MSDNRTAHRAYWEFTISREAMIEAVGKKLDHHAERLAHWEGRMEYAETDLRENGIDFRDAVKPMPRTSVLAASSTPSQYFQQPVMHQEKLSVLQEAQWKVDEHRDMLKTFRSWSRALPHGPAEYTLTFDDVIFFGL